MFLSHPEIWHVLSVAFFALFLWDHSSSVPSHRMSLSSSSDGSWRGMPSVLPSILPTVRGGRGKQSRRSTPMHIRAKGFRSRVDMRHEMAATIRKKPFSRHWTSRGKPKEDRMSDEVDESSHERSGGLSDDLVPSQEPESGSLVPSAENFDGDDDEERSGSEKSEPLTESELIEVEGGDDEDSQQGPRGCEEIEVNGVRCFIALNSSVLYTREGKEIGSLNLEEHVVECDAVRHADSPLRLNVSIDPKSQPALKKAQGRREVQKTEAQTWLDVVNRKRREIVKKKGALPKSGFITFKDEELPGADIPIHIFNLKNKQWEGKYAVERDEMIERYTSQLLQESEGNRSSPLQKKLARKAKDKPTKQLASNATKTEELYGVKRENAQAVKESVEEAKEVNTEREDTEKMLLPAWRHLLLHPRIHHALRLLGFVTPTEIQNRSIFAAIGMRYRSSASSSPSSDLVLINRRDVIGIAETGAGKTLSYGLPILHHLLALQDERAKCANSSCSLNVQPWQLEALIISPTRELSLQVCHHLNSVLQLAAQANSSSSPIPPPRAIPVIGGLAEVKQERQLSRHPAIVVGTPVIFTYRLLTFFLLLCLLASLFVSLLPISRLQGRLWELLESEHAVLRPAMLKLRFIVLDEADRLVESGRFRELRRLLQLLPPSRPMKLSGKGVASPAPLVLEGRKRRQSRKGLMGLASEMEGGSSDGEEEEFPVRQAFLFSATFSPRQPRYLLRRLKDLQSSDKNNTTQKKRKKEEPTTFYNMFKVARRIMKMSTKPVLINITTTRIVSSRVKEIVVKCKEEERDLFLYFFLLHNPGRTIVFVNHISAVRRLAAVLAALSLPAYPFHASMQQRARLKQMDRFASSGDAGVLVATDVAARGLDVPLVRHVIHFDLPLSRFLYTHRSGRAAHHPSAPRGYSVLLLPRDVRGALRKVLNLTDGMHGVTRVATHSEQLAPLRKRVRWAQKLAKLKERRQRRSRKQSWTAKMSRDLELVEEEKDGTDAKASAEETKEIQRLQDLLKKHRILTRNSTSASLTESAGTAGIRSGAGAHGQAGPGGPHRAAIVGGRRQMHKLNKFLHSEHTQINKL
eukprot:756348-Hanusia_phi.AAC.5